MNIVFVYSSAINPQSGGVERVTHTLAKYFESCSCKVYFLCAASDMKIQDSRQLYLPDLTGFFTSINIKYFDDFVRNKSIDVVINQGGTNPDVSKLACSVNVEGVKIISVVHNSLLGSVKNFSASNNSKLIKYRIGWLRSILNVKLFKQTILILYKLKYSSHYKALCLNSNKVFLLSNSYKSELSYLANGIDMENVIGLPNPLSFNNINISKKKNEILYVGRINSSQKRVDLLLNIWSIVQSKIRDWHLNIVGTGEELESMKNLATDLNLKNITFHGFCDPRPFYETASIFAMTSSYEGLPMTLLESMQYGVVPMAFDSFLTAGEIIDDKKNGFLIRPFDVNQYASILINLMSSDKYLECHSLEAKKTADKFSLDVIGSQWIKHIQDIR